MREYKVKYTYDCIMDAIAMSCNIEMNYLLQQGKTAAKGNSKVMQLLYN